MLEIKNVTKIFNKELSADERRVALDNVSITINDGDFITVIGGNGSGKSTLMNSISGVFPLDAGEILIDGVDMTHMPEYERAKFLGRVFQDPHMGTCGNMSILENLELAKRRGKKRGLRWGFTKEDEEKYVELLKGLDLGLETRLSQKVGLLSGGQRQAVTLLMATLITPKLLLLDEHTAALDPKTAKTVLTLTNEIVTKENITTLMITHNMNDAIKYGNRLIMLDHGHVILDIAGEEKKNLTIKDLLKLFEDSSVEASDSLLLNK